MKTRYKNGVKTIIAGAKKHGLKRETKELYSLSFSPLIS
jgi:hypothetical protein